MNKKQRIAHGQEASNITYSTIVFNFDVCRLSKPVSSTNYVMATAWGRRQREGQKSRENNNYTRVSRIFVHFFAVADCTTTTWICLISRFMEDVNKRRRIFLCWLESGPQQINSREKAAGYIWHPNSNLISILSPLPFLIIPYQSRRPPHWLPPSVLFIFIINKSALWYDVYILGNC